MNNIYRIAIRTLLVLSIPLVAMQFTDEVNWSLYDFVVAGLLIFITSIVFEHFTKKEIPQRTRIIYGIIISIVFLLIWAELAVGIFGSPWAGT